MVVCVGAVTIASCGVVAINIADDATVVVGTVIDPEMSDEIRVTVVATGLGGFAAQEPAPVATKVVVDNTTTTRLAEVRPNYSELDKPAVMRNQAAAAPAQAQARPAVKPEADRDMEYLDIPAFLRRQAD